MVTAVVAPGLAAFPAGQSAAATPAAHPAAVIDAVEAALHQGSDAVLIVLPLWHAGVRRSCTLSMATLDDPRVARLSVNLPPLAASGLAVQLAWLGWALPAPGVLFACANHLSSQLVSGAWTRHLGKLERPAPTLGQHLRSLVPGTSFFVAAHPEPGVWPAQPGVFRAAGWKKGPGSLLLAGDAAGVEWLRATELPTLAPAHVLEASPAPLTAAYYGTSNVCEVVATYSDLQALAQQAAQVQMSPCRWCGLEVMGSPCPFCGSRFGAKAG